MSTQEIDFDDNGWPVCFDDDTKRQVLVAYYSDRICVVLTWVNLFLFQSLRLFLDKSSNRLRWMRVAMWWFLLMGFFEGIFAIVAIVEGLGECPSECDPGSCNFWSTVQSNLITWTPLYLFISLVWFQRSYVYYKALESEASGHRAVPTEDVDALFDVELREGRPTHSMDAQ